MPVVPLIVEELKFLFKSGATPSAVIRRIADCHPGEPKLDGLVREYFREAFRVPMLRVGPDQVKHIASGGSLPILNATVLHQMIQARPEWDRSDDSTDSPEGCWLVAASTANAPMPPSDPERIPELTASWDRLDDKAREYIRRMIDNANVMHQKLNGLSMLAEHLQRRMSAVARPVARGA